MAREAVYRTEFLGLGGVWEPAQEKHRGRGERRVMGAKRDMQWTVINTSQNRKT